MRLNFNTFTEAVRLHIAPSIAAALPAAAEAMFGAQPVEIEDETAGLLLLRAISPAFPLVELSGVSVGLSVPLNLGPADLTAHPVFGPWVGENIAAAIASPLVTGARALDLAKGAPHFDGVFIARHEAAFWALANFTFGEGDQAFPATATYGAQLSGLSHVMHISLAGTALYRVGVASRAQREPPTPQASSGGGGLALALMTAGSGAIN